MDRNFFLAIILSLGVLLVWSSFEASRRGDLPPGETIEGSSSPGEIESAPEPETPPIPTPSPTRATNPAPRAAPSVQEPSLASLPEERVAISTELYDAELTSRGGGLLRWELKKYFDKSVAGMPRVELTTPDQPGDVALATPLGGLGLGNLSRADYRVESRNSSNVVFVREFSGLVVRKSYSFEPDDYRVRLRISVENRTTRTVTPTFEVRWPATKRLGPDFKSQSLAAMVDGSLERSALEGFGKGGFFSRGDPLADEVFPREVEWAGAELTYFLAAFVPEVPRDTGARFQVVEPGTAGSVGIAYRGTEIPPGQTAAREYHGYIGPKEADRLQAVGAGLEASISQGWSLLAPLSRFFSWTLRLCYSIIPNYGIAIILLTILVRLVTAPLTAKQMRSMKKMSELQPRLKELQEKHGDDRQKQSQEMMKLYKETGVNPLGGCLPLVLQFPVFIGLYYALQSSIELRQAPFVGWINDLSIPEELFVIPGLGIPFRVLPVIMGASMILQQRMTPSTMDPQQARMMMTVMPVMFTVLFYQFPSGLVLYWMVSNLLAIAHQMWMNRTPTSA